ncbi:MAG: arylsulfatase, partial [Candidatus Cyclobacteriaceae bacterium M3_2C_046]
NIINQPRILIGSENENPVYLNRNDAGGERGIWSQEEVYGKWRVDIQEGFYNVTFKFIEPVESGGRMMLETGPIIQQMKNNSHTDIIEMKNVYLPDLTADLVPFYQVKQKSILPFWVKLEKIE